MREPLRSKVRAAAYTTLALVLALSLASGFRWVQGSEAATPGNVRATGAAESSVAPESVSAAERQASLTPADMRALAEVSQAFVSIAETVTPAVVSIDTRGTPRRMRLPQRFEELFGPFHPDVEETPFDVPLGRGSGFIVSEEGYVLTNNHVVAAAEKIGVELSDGRSFPAELVGRDPTTDIAVLKIEGENLPTIRLGNSDDTSVGEFVLAVGNPGTEFASALPFTVTSGIISAKGRRLGIIRRAAGGSGEFAIEDLIQTDAVINPGNSGGPLVNTRGEAIGVNTAIQSETGFYQGYGFAIPIDLARDVMEDLVEYGRVRRAALRVHVDEVSSADARAFGLAEPRGAVIQDFPEDSPAEDVGMRRGDVIVAVDGRPVVRVGQLQRIIASYEPREEVSVTVIRYGEQLEFDVRLAEANVPEPEPTQPVAAERPGNMLLGIQVSELEPQLIDQAGFEANIDLEGVMVTNVARFGPAYNANLTPGWVIERVNGQPVGSVSEFDEVLSQVESGDVVSFDAVHSTEDGDVVRRIFNLEIPLE